MMSSVPPSSSPRPRRSSSPPPLPLAPALLNVYSMPRADANEKAYKQSASALVFSLNITTIETYQGDMSRRSCVPSVKVHKQSASASVYMRVQCRLVLIAPPLKF